MPSCCVPACQSLIRPTQSRPVRALNPSGAGAVFFGGARQGFKHPQHRTTRFSRPSFFVKHLDATRDEAVANRSNLFAGGSRGSRDDYLAAGGGALSGKLQRASSAEHALSSNERLFSVCISTAEAFAPKDCQKIFAARRNRHLGIGLMIRRSRVSTSLRSTDIRPM